MEGLENPFDSDQIMKTQIVYTMGSNGVQQQLQLPARESASTIRRGAHQNEDEGLDETTKEDVEVEDDYEDDGEVIFDGDVSNLENSLLQETSKADKPLLNGKWSNYSVSMLRSAPHVSLIVPHRSTAVEANLDDEVPSSCFQKKNTFSRRRPKLSANKELYYVELLKYKVEALKSSTIQAAEEQEMKRHTFQMKLQLDEEKLKQEVLKTKLLELEVLEKEATLKDKYLL